MDTWTTESGLYVCSVGMMELNNLQFAIFPHLLSFRLVCRAGTRNIRRRDR